MANEYSINAKITADSTGFEKGIKSAQNSLKGFSSSISSAMKLAGGLFAVGSIAQLGKALSDMSQSYAKATQNIVRGTGAVGDQLKTLQKSVNASLINGVGRDASELGEMVADLNTRLGVTGDTLTELVSQFDDFSDVTGTDTKTAINSVSDVLAKWNIETEKTVPLLDQLTAASQASGASVTELTNGLKSGQAVFSQFGMSATESIAFLGTLKKNGIDTSSAIMGMKTALANFAKSGLDAKTAFAEISESIKNAGSQTEALSIATQTFGQRNGAEFVRILSGGTDGVNAFTEALENAGGTLARTNEASRTSADALQDLKATIAGVFATSGTDNGLRDLIDDVAKAIRNFDFTSIKETFSNIGLFIQGVWEQIKALFNNLSGAVDITGRNFKIFADIIYENLNHAYQVIQDFVGMVSAVLNGDWSVAWEYAKLIVLRTVKQMEESVNNAIKLMPNLFNSVVEGYNWVLEQQDKLFLEIFHLPEKYFKSAKLPKFEGKDLIDTKSIEEAIEEVRKTIESKTGKIADRTLADLKKQKEAVHATTQSVTADIGSLGTAVGNMTETTGTKVSDFFAEWTKQYEDLAGNWEKTFSDMANIGAQAMGDMFQQLGQDLVDGGIGFENYSAVAVQAISQVLVALSAQISALGVTHALTLDFAGAALAAAGAAAALAAAGALGAVAKNMRSTAEETSAVTAALEEFIKLLNELRSGKLTSSEFASSFVSLRKIVKDTNDYLYKSVELFADIQDKYSKLHEKFPSWHDVWKRGTREELEMYDLLSDTLDVVKDNLYVAIIKQSLALASYNTLLAETVENQKKEIESGKELSDMYQTLYSDINKFYELLRNEQMIQVQGLRTSLLESMASLGADIGKMLTDGIKNGASKSDFAESLKELIREKMIEIAVYTEQFQTVLSDAGTKLMSGIVGGDDSLIQQAKEQIEALYDTAVQTAETVDKKLSSIFKSIKNTAKSATNSIAESMKSVSESAVTSLRNLAGSQKQINTLLSGLKTQSKSWETVHKASTNLLKSSANSAKTTLEAAKKNLETQQKALDNASKKLNDSKAKLATAQQNLALSPYYGDLGIIIASQAYNQALVEQTSALKKYEEAEQKKNEAVQKSNSAQLAYNDALSAYEAKLSEVNPYLSQINEAESRYNALITETKNQLSNENVAIKAQIEAYKDLLTAQKDTVGFQNQIVNVRNQVLGIYDELSASALSLGESLVNAIANGMSKKDFSLELKDYIRQNIIKLNVYSGEMSRTLATAGERLTAAIISQDTAGIKNAKSHMMTAYNEIDSLMKNIDKQLDDIFGVAEKTTTVVQQTEENVSSFQRAINSFKDSIADLGGDIASNLISSLSSGLDAGSALLGFKKFLREYIVKSYVYTESMKSQIEKIGKLIGKTLDGSISKNELSNVANAVKSTYGKLADSMKSVDTMLDSVFGKEAEKEIKDTGSTITKELSKIESAMDSFKKTVSDLGGDIASNLIDGLSSGLSQSDFLSNMKDWIKKMLVQSVVYTEQMKSQIEAIGKAISNAISGGFTETSMHEIRRDLSFIFEQASSKMSGIDKILGGVFDGYASGTTSALSGLHIVGERGPELVRFNGGERVYNNADTMKMIAGAGTTINQNVTFNNLKDTSAFAMMSQLKQYNREMAINGIL